MSTKKKDAKKPAAKKPTKTNVQPPDELTVSDVAREHGVDPKKARAALRAAGMKSKDGRWPTFKRDSKQHREVLGAIVGESPEVVLTAAPKK